MEFKDPVYTKLCALKFIVISAEAQMAENCDESKEERIRTKTQRQKQIQRA